nr:3'-5' exonuclease [Lysinibacillus timonensis]
MSRNETYIFLDIEATLIHGKQHIIEIGAVKWKPDGTIDTFQHFIKPNKFRKLNQHIQQLTGITTEEILSAPVFPTVIQKFKNWCNGDVTFVTFGEFDRKVLEEELLRHRMNCNFIYPMIDFQQKYMIEYQRKDQPGLKGLLESLEIDIENQHRALVDATSLYKIFEILNGSKIIESQKTNEFSMILSEIKQDEKEYELTLSYLSGNITENNLSILTFNTIHCHLPFQVCEIERIDPEGEKQLVQVTEVNPNPDVQLLLNHIAADIKGKVLITRSGMKQISKVLRIHGITLPKTEVMTLHQLMKNEAIVNQFTLDGQPITAYEKKILTLIEKYKYNIIDEFKIRNLYIKEEVFTLS